MFHIHVLLTVNDPADVPEIEHLLARAGQLSRDEPGCVRFEVYHSESDSQVFLLTEWWDSEDDWKAHREREAFQEIYQPLVLPRVTRTPHICRLVG